MKVLWLSHLVPYPPKGGVLQRSYYLLREMSKYHDVYLVAFIQKDLLAPMYASLEQGLEEARLQLGRFCRDVVFVDIPCDQRRHGKAALALKSLFTPTSYTVNWLQAPAMSRAVADQLEATAFDVVHADTISLAPYVEAIPTPKILDHHNIESHMMWRRAQLERNPVKKLYFFQEAWKLERYEKKACPKFDLNVTCSALDRDRLSQLIGGASRIREVPNGVDCDYFKPDRPGEGDNGIVFAGRLSAYTNRKAVLYIAEQIWPEIAARIPGVACDIVGASPPDALLRLAKTDSRFRVHGFVDDVRPYIDQAGIYVCPITDGGGTKLKILDALAMGKPIVAHPVACEGIDVTPNENVLYACSGSEFADHIERLIQDPGERRRLGINARRLAEERYSYQSIGMAFSDLAAALPVKGRI